MKTLLESTEVNVSYKVLKFIPSFILLQSAGSCRLDKSEIIGIDLYWYIHYIHLQDLKILTSVLTFK